ncbi:unnamed protein product [Merluccius merluccius]
MLKQHLRSSQGPAEGRAQGVWVKGFAGLVNVVKSKRDPQQRVTVATGRAATSVLTAASSVLAEEPCGTRGVAWGGVRGGGRRTRGAAACVGRRGVRGAAGPFQTSIPHLSRRSEECRRPETLQLLRFLGNAGKR